MSEACCAASRAAGRNFCTVCGRDLRGERVVVTARKYRAPEPDPRLVACRNCGAGNAASRVRCGRCGRTLAEEVQVPPPPPADVAPGRADGLQGFRTLPPPERAGPSAALFVAVIVAALVTLGVVGTILSARGVGIFGNDDPDPEDLVALPVVRAETSSVLEPGGAASYGPDNLVDGDPSTSWQEGASGDGNEEWVELILDTPAEVSRLLIWNGHQKGTRFADHNRVSQVRIEVAGRELVADLLDIEGPQAVDLPEPLTTDRVRVVILAVHRGLRYSDTAISEIDLYGLPD